MAKPLDETQFQAQRLGAALQSLAAELVEEREEARRLRREIAELKAQLKAPRAASPSPERTPRQ